jgi:hypothetical protein
VSASASIAEMSVRCDPAKGWRETAAQNLFPVHLPPPGAKVCDFRQFGMGERGAASEIPERRARKDDIRLNAARPCSVLAPCVQALVPIAHVGRLAIGLRSPLGRGWRTG